MIVYIPGRCWARYVGLGHGDRGNCREVFRSQMLDGGVQWRLQPLHQLAIRETWIATTMAYMIEGARCPHRI